MKVVIKIQPIYKELIQMWHDKGLDIPIQEGMYWLDNGIIKAFDKYTTDKDRLCCLYKINIKDDLSMSYHQHRDFKKNKDKIFETWSETVKRYNYHLNQIEKNSICLLKKYGLNTDRKIIDTNSTGKDSMVKTYLANKAGLQFKTYFNVTTLDVSESNRMAKGNKYNFTFPEDKYGGFYQWQKRENIVPSRLNRCCCKYFKEDATIHSFSPNDKLLFLFGMRNDESNSRSGYTDEWINQKWGKQRDWIGILPIRQWTDVDIWLYIFRENIEINPKYKMGYNRVVCGIACPNYSKSTWVLDQYWYPKMYQRWRDILRKDFIDNNKWLIMNCTIQEYVQKAWNGGVYRTEPTDDVIQEYAIYNDLDFKVAKKYFNRYCMNGCLNKRHKPQKIKDKETLGMNMKMFGRQTEKFKCKKCLIKEFGWTKDDWNNYVDDFKRLGCKLF